MSSTSAAACRIAPTSARSCGSTMGRELRIVAVLAAVLAGACVVERHQALVVCHNSNCAGPPDPTRDDSLEAMYDSLALRDEGRPTIDGIEVDTLWDGATD